jgi:hypothetical protein
MDNIWIIIAVVDVICAQLIAQYIGRKRKIGYGKSVFWSIVLGPVFGLLITLLSKRLQE